MDFIRRLKEQLPDYAKDIRLNLEAVLARSSLVPTEALGAALAAAFAARATPVVETIRQSGQLERAHIDAALTAAALMGMNNVWYPFVEMAGDETLKTQRAELRMNAYANHGGVDRRSFEVYALAASIVGKCEFCVRSHARQLREAGLGPVELRDVGRIAAVMVATAQVLAAERAAIAA